jgi:Na+/phosphate symporter
MLFGLSESQKAVTELFSGWQNHFYQKGLDGKFNVMVQRCVDVVLLEASPQRSLYSGLALYNLRVLSLRASVLMMCMSTLAAWWPLILCVLFLGIASLYVLAFAFISFLSFSMYTPIKKIFRLVMMTGIFLLGGELMIRNSSVLMVLFEGSEYGFFLLDGRFPAVISVCLMAILISFILEIEFWSVALALSLLLSNMITANGVLGLLAGERIGSMILFWLRSLDLNQDCRRVGSRLAIFSILGVFIGVLVAGELRFTWGFSFSMGADQWQGKSLQLVWQFATILFFQFTAQMIWGHFGSKEQLDEVQEAKYFPKKWITRDLISANALLWAKDRVQKRLGEIRYHLQGLASMETDKVPAPLQTRLKDEEHQLQEFLNEGTDYMQVILKQSARFSRR